MLQDKRDLFCSGLTDVGIDFILPKGGYFVVAKIDPKYFDMAGIDMTAKVQPDALLESRRDVQFSRFLTTEIGVSPIPMSPFYAPNERHLADNYIRFAYCKDDETLNAAIERLKRAFA